MLWQKLQIMYLIIKKHLHYKHFNKEYYSSYVLDVIIVKQRQRTCIFLLKKSTKD